MHKGSCLCGGVEYELHGPLRDVLACHCIQCRKTSGHYWAATNVPRDKLVLTKTGYLALVCLIEIGRTWFLPGVWCQFVLSRA